MPTEVVVAIFCVLVLGCFTEFYGLGTLWANRGSWYSVDAKDLPTVMQSLLDLRAFDDSDGLPFEHIKMKAVVESIDAPVSYDVKVPTRIFKYLKVRMTETAKLQAIGLAPKD